MTLMYARRRGEIAMLNVSTAYWRTGRKLGRSIYALIALEASDDDVFIGIMDNSEVAEQVVNDHNRLLDS